MSKPELVEALLVPEFDGLTKIDICSEITVTLVRSSG